MEPNNLRFGGGAIDTILSPLNAVVLLLAVILILCLPRKYVIVPLFLAIFMVSLGQVVVIAGLHFTVMRILILAGLGKLLILGRKQSGGIFAGGFNSIDRVFAFFALMQFVTFSLEWMAMQAFIRSLGGLLDTLGGYCVMRFLVRDKEDIRRAIKVFAIVAVVIGACMIGEQITHKNIFWLLSGTKGVVAEREGKFRSQGPFEVYLTAGAFGATLLPLLVWLWSDAKSRFVTCLGMAGATAMTLTPISSTPLLAYVAGIMALCFWRFRQQLRILQWSLISSLIGLQLVMKAPVWALIARVDLTGSSSGYHRYMLVDNFIRHFGDWWLLGFKGYAKWGWDMWDLSNQFVAYGLTGGLVTLASFITLLSLSFAGLGRARKLVVHRRGEGWFFWCLGAALFAHMVAFFGMNYFDQMQFAFYSLLAIISVSVYRVRRQPGQKSVAARKLWEWDPDFDPLLEPPVNPV
jgi:hypothetical protein